jgi:hypothetical protein
MTGLRPVGQRLLGAGHGEQAEARGVEQQHRCPEPADPVGGEEAQQAGGDGGGEVAPVGDGRGRHGADQQIAGNAARDGGGPGNHQHAEQVKAPSHAACSAADGEHEGGAEIHRIEQHRFDITPIAATRRDGRVGRGRTHG